MGSTQCYSEANLHWTGKQQHHRTEKLHKITDKTTNVSRRCNSSSGTKSKHRVESIGSLKTGNNGKINAANLRNQKIHPFTAKRMRDSCWVCELKKAKKIGSLNLLNRNGRFYEYGWSDFLRTFTNGFFDHKKIQDSTKINTVWCKIRYLVRIAIFRTSHRTPSSDLVFLDGTVSFFGRFQ